MCVNVPRHRVLSLSIDVNKRVLEIIGIHLENEVAWETEGRMGNAVRTQGLMGNAV